MFRVPLTKALRTQPNRSRIYFPNTTLRLTHQLSTPKHSDSVFAPDPATLRRLARLETSHHEIKASLSTLRRGKAALNTSQHCESASDASILGRLSRLEDRQHEMTSDISALKEAVATVKPASKREPAPAPEFRSRPELTTRPLSSFAYEGPFAKHCREMEHIVDNNDATSQLHSKSDRPDSQSEQATKRCWKAYVVGMIIGVTVLSFLRLENRRLERATKALKEAIDEKIREVFDEIEEEEEENEDE